MLQTHPLDKKKVWIYLEGCDDKRLFGTIFHEDHVVLVATNGITSVKSVVRGLLQSSEKYKNVIGIVDADFDRILGVKNLDPNIFLTDNHDAEMMLIQNDTMFTKITSILLADKDIRDRCDYVNFRKRILEVLVWFSLIRLYNCEHEMKLNFEKFPIHTFIDFEESDISFRLRKSECITLVNQRSANKTGEIKEADIDTMSSETFDNWNLCNGHDFLKVWAQCLNCLTRKNINESNLRENICMAFNLEIFRKTQLYKELQDWERISLLYLFPTE
jgi:hypothetical protein